METVLHQYSRILQNIYWLAYLQALWILFTLMGGIVFGIFPATYALFIVIREQDRSSTHIFRQFKRIYQASFFRLNVSSVIWFSMIILLGINVLFLQESQQIIKLVSASMLVFIIFCIIHFLTNFEMHVKVIEQVKQSFLYTFINPRKNIGYAFLLVLIGVSFYLFPGVTFFFYASVSAKVIATIEGSSSVAN